MPKKNTGQSNLAALPGIRKRPRAQRITDDYFRIRDFELVQPLYDLAFLLEIEAVAKGSEIPKYRTFSLWRAGLSLDGYGTTIDRWLDGIIRNDDLDYVPSLRIKQQLGNVRLTGTLPELHAFQGEGFARCLRLRSVRGLGPSAIAQTISRTLPDDEWLRGTGIDVETNRTRIAELWSSINLGPWQSAHLVPPILRFLKRIFGAKEE